MVAAQGGEAVVNSGRIKRKEGKPIGLQEKTNGGDDGGL